jgi:hypothetical protein
MEQDRDVSGSPIVALDPGKLLGLRQVSQASGKRADEASRDAQGVAGNGKEVLADASRLLSKVGVEVLT